jgi:pyruvate dehydrogenase E2 component (dihydrolipoamide acetyltransferase)
MAVEIKIPIPDQTTEEVRIVAWLKSIGDKVKKGEMILEIETEKAVMEVESVGEGVLLKQLVKVNDIVPVGQVVGFIGPKGTSVETKTASDVQKKPKEQTPRQAEIKASTEPVKLQTKDADGRIFASPNAKRLAAKLNVDISLVTGTGPNGKITGKDVKAYARSKPVSDTAGSAGDQPGIGIEIKLTRKRRAVERNLQKSYRYTPLFNITMAIDMTRAMEFHSELNIYKQKDEKISVNDLIVKGCALALRKYPQVNSKFMEDKIRLKADVNIGIATALEKVLAVPVVLNADNLDWSDLAAETKRIVSEARNGILVGAGKETFTISNLGMFGVDTFTAIISPPEVAILAVESIKDEVVSVDGMVEARPIMKVTLYSDHRIVRAIAEQFLGSLKRYLEEEIA